MSLQYGESSPKSSIPKARPAPSRPVANRSVSFSLLVVIFTLITVVAVRQWKNITTSLIPQAQEQIVSRLGLQPTLTPVWYDRFTSDALSDVTVSYDDSGVLITDSEGSTKRLYNTPFPTRVLLARAGSQSILITQLIGDEQIVILYRLPDESTSELLRFPTSITHANSLLDSIDISPSGRYIAYGHGGGNISLFDLSTHDDKLLLVAQTCSDTNKDDRPCSIYTNPQWSPDGELLLLQKTIFDSNTLVVAHPFDDPVRLDDLEYASRQSVWLPSNTAIIASGLYESLNYLGHFVDVAKTPLLGPIEADIPVEVTSLTLSNSTVIAFTYQAVDATVNTQSVATYDVKRQRLLTVLTDHTDHLRTVAWMPDNEHILMSDTTDPVPRYFQLNSRTGKLTPHTIHGTYGMYIGK